MTTSLTPEADVAREIDSTELCDILKAHDGAVVECVKATTWGRGTKTADKALRVVNRKIFQRLIGRPPTPEELDACGAG